MIQNNGSNFTSYMDGKFGISASSGGYNMRSNPVIGKGWGSGNTGGSHYFMGEIKEVILFDKILSDKERYVITHYLSKKWGLEDFVDSDGESIVDGLDDNPYGEDIKSLSDTIVSNIGDLAGDITHLNSKLKLWLDASNINGNNNKYVKNGQKISKWYDLSGNDYHLTQSTISRQPIYNETGLNNMPVIDFDGDKFLLSGNFNSTSDITVLAVLQVKNSWGSWGYIFGHGNRDGNWSFERMNNTLI